MSDLQNPLFDEEKEFLERKKLEYERALRGDVEHIKEKSVKVGKVAAVGAGLAGSIWLITKAFSGKKRNRHVDDEDRDEFEADRYEDHDFDHHDEYRRDFGPERPEHDDFDEENDEEFGAEYYTAGNGKRYRSVVHRKSAAASANAFMEQDSQGEQYEADDLGFGATASAPHHEESAGGYAEGPRHEHEPSSFDPQEFQDDPFQDLPYDDSRRLPASHAYDDATDGQAPRSAGARSNMVGSVLKAFLQTDTGKVIVGQVAAVALALVTKKVSEFFPADKNPDLAASPGDAPATTGATPAVSLASPDSPDASTHSSSL